jgi:hypothetical protein
VDTSNGRGLFDLSGDIGEKNDLSKKKPEVLKRVKVRRTPISGHGAVNLSYGGGVLKMCISLVRRNQGFRGFGSVGSVFWKP